MSIEIETLRSADLDDQIIEPVGYDFGLSRRTFVQVLGAGILIATSATSLLGQERQRGGGGGRRESRPVPLDARLHIGKDGKITVMTGKVEGGQGARAQITQAAAEELGVGVDQVTLIMADTALVPDDGITAGSRTTPSTLPSVRQACATARMLLRDASAKAGKELTYADLATDSAADLLQQVGSPDVQLIDATNWKVLGAPVSRPNGRDLVTGSHHYPADVIREGMLYGKILRPPSFNAKLLEIDLAPAQAMKDMVVVRDGSFVAVAGANTHAAKEAIAELEKSAKWETSPQVSSDKVYDYLREHARDLGKDETGATHRATYNVAYVQHAPMEPRVAVAEWTDGKVTIWTSSQNPFGVRREVAGAFHIDEANVRVIVPDFGGGFGGKHTGETALEAARIAQAAKKPVALRWTREEEFTWATFRPAAVIDASASLDGDGKITSWRFININSGPSSLQPPYRVGKNDSRFVQSDPPLRHGSYRALAATANSFARESFIDELALAAKMDPLEFRLVHLEDQRLRAVLEEAANRFDWTDRRAKKRDNTGVGLACSIDKNSFVAACAEVEVDRTKGVIRVVRICQAFDCGAVTSPSNLLSQVQGAIIMALGPALREEMEFEGSRIINASFWKYEVPRFKDVPELDVHLINRLEQPSVGAGETPLIAAAPAIANAVFHATGVRLREMPMRFPVEKGDPRS